MLLPALSQKKWSTMTCPVNSPLEKKYSKIILYFEFQSKGDFILCAN